MSAKGKVKPIQHVPHVLVIDQDDDTRALTLDKLSAHGYRTTEAHNIQEAVEQLRRHRFTLLVIDPVTSGKDSYSLLKTLQSHKILSGMPIMVITSSRDSSVFDKCTKYGASSHVEKEIESDSLHKRIIKLLVNKKKINFTVDAETLPENDPSARNRLIQKISSKLQKEEIQLPSAPKLLGKVINMLYDEEVNLHDVSELIEKEPNVSARILKAANSAGMGSGNPVRNTHEAVIRLGVKRIINYVLIVNNAEFFSFEHPVYKEIREELWRHSLMVSVCAKYIGERIGFSNPDNLFSYGLLHDIGKFSLLRVVQELPKDDDSTDPDSVWMTLDKFHTQFGGTLLDNWNFPKEFVHVARYHHDAPIKGLHARYLIITSFANAVIDMMDEGIDETKMSQLLRLPHAHILKITQNLMKDLPKAIDEEMKALSQLI
ncbi:MAG: response regulator [Gammaproteobacteria bacterium]|nr:response regulator [Gammaproteobacteria bacterium]MDH5729025.1 response regulator [Gammaproteobacteria bacterium]